MVRGRPADVWYPATWRGIDGVCLQPVFTYAASVSEMLHISRRALIGYTRRTSGR